MAQVDILSKVLSSIPTWDVNTVLYQGIIAQWLAQQACSRGCPGFKSRQGRQFINLWLKRKFNSFEFEYHHCVGLCTNWTIFNSLSCHFHLGNKSSRDPIPDWSTWPLFNIQTEDWHRCASGPVRAQFCYKHAAIKIDYWLAVCMQWSRFRHHGLWYVHSEEGG